MFFLFVCFTHSATLCLLIGVFSPFTFKVVMDRCVVIAILFTVFCFWSFYSFLLFFPCALTIIFSVMFVFLSLYFFVYVLQVFDLGLP